MIASAPAAGFRRIRNPATTDRRPEIASSHSDAQDPEQHHGPPPGAVSLAANTEQDAGDAVDQREDSPENDEGEQGDAGPQDDEGPERDRAEAPKEKHPPFPRDRLQHAGLQ